MAWFFAPNPSRPRSSSTSPRSAIESLEGYGYKRLVESEEKLATMISGTIVQLFVGR